MKHYTLPKVFLSILLFTTTFPLFPHNNDTQKSTAHFFSLAQKLQEQNNKINALQLYKKVLSIDPDHHEALLNAADILYSQKNTLKHYVILNVSLH